MNRLEVELYNLNTSITAVGIYLKGKKNMRYEDWCNAHKYLEGLKARRDKLLSEKFGGDIV